jgi:hypothetical protein
MQKKYLPYNIAEILYCIDKSNNAIYHYKKRIQTF